MAIRPFAYPEGHRALPIDRTWLTMMLKETPSGIAGPCTYKDELLVPDAIQNWIVDFKMILAKAAANPQASLGQLADL